MTIFITFKCRVLGAFTLLSNQSHTWHNNFSRYPFYSTIQSTKFFYVTSAS